MALPGAAPPHLQATPSQSNTLWLEAWESHGGSGAQPGASATMATTVAAAVEAAAPFASSPVLFLGALPQLEGPVGELPPHYADACAFLQPWYEFHVDRGMQERRLARLLAA